MQTILGASGQIGTELARALNAHHCTDLRLVSRNPNKINHTDSLFAADLLDAKQTHQAVTGSEITYLVAGLPMDTARWMEQWPIMMRNVIDACAAHQSKLVYFDNTYMYPQTNTPQTEQTPFIPNGDKGKVRAAIANHLLDAMNSGKVEAMICRAPEFYGPEKTQSITNVTVLERMRKGKKAFVFLRDDTLRSLIYTPDASAALALLGNTEDAYSQTWHLPCDDNRLTYQQLVRLCEEILQRDCDYKVLKRWQLKLIGLLNKQIAETDELLPRYETDNIFISDKFKQRFRDFAVTPYREGLRTILLGAGT